MATGNVRLFTALWPPAGVRDALARLAAAWQWPGTERRVDPSRFHLTLHFLGAVPAGRVAAVRAGLDVPCEPATLQPDASRQVVWPGGIAVLELDAPPALHALHARLGAALARLGVAVESRPWRPHVTFARRAAHARPAAAMPLPAWRVDSGYALVRSTPGAGYTTVALFGAGGL